MENTLINIARILYEAYPHSDLLPIDPGWDCSDLTALLERVTTHDIGDGLFRFIVIEIIEGGESTLSGAIRVMERAGRDIEAVLHALRTAKAAFESNQENSRNAAPEEPGQPCQDDIPYRENLSSYCAAAEYIAAEGNKIFTGHMNGGLWNARCLDACLLSKRESEKAAYEFLVKHGDQYAQNLSEDSRMVWRHIRDNAAAMLSSAGS